MLPSPSALDHQDQGSPPYSPYTSYRNNHGASVNTQFAHHQQPWGYFPDFAAVDMYNGAPPPLQQRPNPHMQGHFPGAHPGMGPPPMHMGPYGGQLPMSQHYPAALPGPPIRTTASKKVHKGPGGANLFIFHIPNQFTNLDMYRLFCQYGNVLSVRIMVEKDTGRSRGFGFVSYDSPDSAALAIDELNGFAVSFQSVEVTEVCKSYIRGSHILLLSDRQQTFDGASSADSR